MSNVESVKLWKLVKASNKQWIESEWTIINMQKAIERVRELHKPMGCDCAFHKKDEVWCKSCYKNYPCPTIQALDGEQE